MKLSLYSSLVLLSFYHLTAFAQPGELIFDNSRVHDIRVISLYKSLPDTLTDNYIKSFGFGQIQIRKIPYAPARIEIDGTLTDTVGIRYKGYNSWWSSQKKPIRIDFNQYVDGQMFDGLTKINLHNGASDPTFIRENLSYAILKSLGVKTPRTAYAKVYMDNEYVGLYRIVEQVDNTFLDVNFGSHDGNIYSQQSSGSGGFDLSWRGSNSSDYQNVLDLENHKTENDWSTLIHFLDFINHASDQSFQNEIDQYFDVDGFLSVVAYNIAVNNIDWYGDAGRNYFLAEVNGKIHWIPWDFNLTWRAQEPDINIDPDQYPLLIQRLLKVPFIHQQYLNKFCFIKKQLQTDSLLPMIDHEVNQIKDILEVDPLPDYPFEAFETNLETDWEDLPGIKAFAASRVNQLSLALADAKIDCEVITGIPEEEGQVKMFPNPAREKVEIVIPEDGDWRVAVYNNVGRLIDQRRGNGNIEFDVSAVPAGIYWVKVMNGRVDKGVKLIVTH